MPMDKTPGSVSPPQKNLIRKLINEKDISGLSLEQRQWLANDFNIDQLSKFRASDIIQALLALPKLPTVPAELASPSLPAGTNPVTGEPAKTPDAGYYFVVDPTTTKESFFRVQKGKADTKWEGYTFLAIQASDDFYAVKDPIRRQIIFDCILENPVQSMNEYGLRLGRCGMCNRTLTDRDSRLRGLGPICAAKIPATDAQVELLSQLGLTSST